MRIFSGFLKYYSMFKVQLCNGLIYEYKQLFYNRYLVILTLEMGARKLCKINILKLNINI